ncbi:MAG TPA: glycosyltransferase family 4 protein [Gaiellaceae bacterium]|jgi:glycosyltransferase involved in cell wall biosynthesis|nr:glycosyltransferase family 4 protein [Gaiellaceae bacterium]
MRIVHVLTESRGGGYAHAHYLAEAARERGDTTTLLAPATPRLLASELGRADLVHAHGVRAAVECLPFHPHPIVVTTHGLHAVRRARGGLSRRAAERLSWLAARRADAVICVSSDERSAICELSSSLTHRCRLILNGVEPVPAPTRAERQSARRRLGLAQGIPVILFLGGLREQKDPLLALASVELAARRVPGLRLLIAGEGPLEAAVCAAAGPEVSLLGWSDDVTELLLACDVVLNTSRWEGLSLSLLEGLWRARPIIATKAPGNREAVGDAGIVVDAYAPLLADAIERFFTEPGLREHLAARARRRAEALFDVHAMTRTTLELYDELTARAR